MGKRWHASVQKWPHPLRAHPSVHREALTQCQVLTWATRGGSTSLAGVTSLEEGRQWFKARRLERAFDLQGSMAFLERALYEKFLVYTPVDEVVAAVQGRLLLVRPEGS
jgi:hypothetical protein